jgi:hypothetical protein
VIEEVEQRDHFLSPNDRVVLTKDGFKKMSYKDVLEHTLTYRVVEVVNKHNFKIRVITK